MHSLRPKFKYFMLLAAETLAARVGVVCIFALQQAVCAAQTPAPTGLNLYFATLIGTS